eukprot:Ihof_evm2s888 gene=Ihof_evmTU2s888
MINNLIGMELAYINTNHPDFVGGQKAVSEIMERQQTQKFNPGNKASNQSYGSLLNPQRLAGGSTQGLTRKDMQAYVQEQTALAAERAKNPKEVALEEVVSVDRAEEKKKDQNTGLWNKWFGTTPIPQSSSEPSIIPRINSDTDLYDADSYGQQDEEHSKKDQMETELI